MKKLIGILIFIVSFLIYHLGFGCNVFPVDENNVLQAPTWYPALGIALSVAVAITLSNLGPIVKKINEYTAHLDPLGERKHLSERKVDALYGKAVAIVLETNNASMSMLQRKLDISFDNAKQLISRMEQDGIVGPLNGTAPREILISQPLQAKFSFKTELEKIDFMEGHQFEYWCADLLRKIGFQDVEVTRGSGDQGVDILAVKGGIKYAIQCKCYSSDLGNKPIQEINTGKMIYRCQIGAVMTNRHFTAGGKEAAEATGVLLWDRDWIRAALESTWAREG